MSIYHKVTAQEKEYGLSYLDPTRLDSLYWDALSALPTLPVVVHNDVQYVLTHTSQEAILLTIESPFGNEYYIFTLNNKQWICDDTLK